MENKLIEIKEEQIQLNFILDDTEYIVFTENEIPEEGDDLYFAKINYLDDGEEFLVNLSDEEYEKAKKEYESYLELVDETKEEIIWEE